MLFSWGDNAVFVQAEVAGVFSIFWTWILCKAIKVLILSPKEYEVNYFGSFLYTLQEHYAMSTYVTFLVVTKYYCNSLNLEKQKKSLPLFFCQSRVYKSFIFWALWIVYFSRLFLKIKIAHPVSSHNSTMQGALTLI